MVWRDGASRQSLESQPLRKLMAVKRPIRLTRIAQHEKTTFVYLQSYVSLTTAQVSEVYPWIVFGIEQWLAVWGSGQYRSGADPSQRMRSSRPANSGGESISRQKRYPVRLGVELAN
jgi:hypothetical protein